MLVNSCVLQCVPREATLTFANSLTLILCLHFMPFRGLPSLIWMHAVYSVGVCELLYVFFTVFFFLFFFISQNHTHASHTLTESKDNQSISTLWGQSWETLRRTLKCVVLNYQFHLIVLKNDYVPLWSDCARKAPRLSVCI